MVRKLFKHEIMALGRMMFPVLCAVLGVGLFTRMIQLFATDSVAYGIVETSSFVVLVIAIVASIFLALIFGVVRYYKNLFTCEGYLTFTLPVTTAQHIWVKVIVAVLFMAAAVIASVVALVIAFLGKDLADIWHVITYVWDAMVKQNVNMVHIVIYIVEAVIFLIAYAFMMYFLYYSCITIGQMAKKNRVMAAVGVYFLYYIITQISSTILTVLLTLYGHLLPMDWITMFIEKNPYLCGHLLFVGMMVLCAIMTTIYYLICHTIIRKKLNLE